MRKEINKMYTFLGIVLALVLVFAVFCFESWLGMVIINWVAELFLLNFEITFWQAFGLCVLLSFIGGFFKSTSSSKK